jgi:ketosteroid isomerase-like protein
MAEGVKEQLGDVVSQAKRRVGLEQPSAADDDGRIGIVRGAWKAFGEGDFDAFVDVMHEEIQWEGPDGKGFPGGGSREGRDGIKDGFITDIDRTYTSFGFRPESFLDAEDVDAVVVIGRFEAEGVEGATLDEEAVQVWEFKGNTVARVRVFVDSDPFPDVVTERKLEEWEQEEKEKEEGKDDDDSDSDDAKASDDSDDGDSEDKDSDSKDSDDEDDSGEKRAETSGEGDGDSSKASADDDSGDSEDDSKSESRSEDDSSSDEDSEDREKQSSS